MSEIDENNYRIEHNKLNYEINMHKQKCKDYIENIYRRIENKLQNGYLHIDKLESNLSIDINEEVEAINNCISYYNKKCENFLDRKNRIIEMKEILDKKKIEEEERKLISQKNEFNTKIELFNYNNDKNFNKGYLIPITKCKDSDDNTNGQK